MKNIVIVGHGYVGKAVEYGFNIKLKNKIQLIDPLYNNSIDDITGCDVAFVCVPTPFGEDGKIDSSIVEDVTEQLLEQTRGWVVIKSTVIPSVVAKLSENQRVIYNPEFLTEKNALDDFVNPPMHIFGGSSSATNMLEELYKNNSRCKPCPVFKMSAQDASFVKYGINSFLATKVMWFNQYKELIDQHGSDYDTIINAIGTDSRIGHSHVQVPGPDGRRGYGGACFPKDTSALSNFDYDRHLTILRTVITANNYIRAGYELDDREKEQNVVYMKR